MYTAMQSYPFNELISVKLQGWASDQRKDTAVASGDGGYRLPNVAHCVAGKGAGDDFEIESEPEHPSQRCIFRSTVRGEG